MTIEDLGWIQYKATLSAPVDEAHVARVLSENKTNYTVLSKAGQRLGVLRGKALQHLDAQIKPKAGDWITFSEDNTDSLAVIESILPRHTKLSRYASGEIGEEQVLVTNVDRVFIMQGLDGDFNLNRLERYLLMAQNGEVEPIILLNKSDLVADVSNFTAQVRDIAPSVPLITLSAVSHEGIEVVQKYLEPQTTSVFVGSSGVGKSTFLNTLLGKDVQETQGLRDDDRGRHTTTRRELFILSSGAIIIDTPGMRELQVIKDTDDVDTFSDIEMLASECKYTKCDHIKSQGCALKDAVERGDLNQKRLDNFLKLEREMGYEKSNTNKGYHRERTARIKKTQKRYKKILKEKNSKREEG